MVKKSTKTQTTSSAGETDNKRKPFIDPIEFVPLTGLPQPTRRQKMFCIVHCEMLQKKPSEAYRKVYTEVTAASAASSASALLKKPNIIAYIQQLERHFSAATELNIIRVRSEISRLATSNILDYFNYDESTGNFTVKPPAQWKNPEAVAKLTATTYRGETKVAIELYNKMDALTLAAKILGEVNDFNSALSTLRRYGYRIKEKEDGLICEDMSAAGGVSSVQEALEMVEQQGFTVETIDNGFYLKNKSSASE